MLISSKRSFSTGFTLIEILLAIVLISSLLILLLLSVNQLLSRQSITAKGTQAALRIQQTMESLYGMARTEQWDALDPNPQPYYIEITSDANWNLIQTAPADPDLGIQVAVYISKAYRGTDGELDPSCTAESVNCTLQKFMKKAVLEADWPSNQGQPLNLETYVIKPEYLQLVVGLLGPSPTPTATPTAEPTATPTTPPTPTPTVSGPGTCACSSAIALAESCGELVLCIDISGGLVTDFPDQGNCNLGYKPVCNIPVRGDCTCLQL